MLLITRPPNAAPHPPHSAAVGVHGQRRCPNTNGDEWNGAGRCLSGEELLAYLDEGGSPRKERVESTGWGVKIMYHARKKNSKENVLHIYIRKKAKHNYLPF